MLNAWYSLIVGILITLSGVIFLIFSLDDFKQPNWYIGLMLIVGVLGVIFGIVGVMKRSKMETDKTTEITEATEDTEKPE